MTLTHPVPDVRDRAALLSRLYAEQTALGGADEHGYMRQHGQSGVVLHQVNVFEWYASLIAPGSTVLDWGCNHGPDSCLLRHRFGDELDLHACDFAAEDAFVAFRAFSRAKYARLTDPFKLPYANEAFDAIVGSGALEHAAMDGESLKELYRVLKPHGLLVVTYLPHAYSWDEWRRRSRGVDFHRRLYTRRGFARLLLSHGFAPERIELQGFVPNRLRERRRPLWLRVLGPALPAVAESLWKPVFRTIRYPLFAHSVLCGVARKVTCM